MRKILCIAVLILALCALWGAASAAEPGMYENGAWRYTVTERGDVRLDRYLGASDQVIVPVVIDGAAVRELHYTFAGLPVRTVLLPAGLREIGEYAFCGCEKLESVKSAVPVTAFGEGCFYGCTALKETPAADPETLSVGPYAFWRCVSLREADLSSETVTLGECAFAFCSGLGKADFSADSGSALYVGSRAFTGTPEGAVVLPERAELDPGCDRETATGNAYDHYSEELALAWTTRDCMEGECGVLRYDRPREEYADRPEEVEPGVRFGWDFGVWGTAAKALETAELCFDGSWAFQLLPDGTACVTDRIGEDTAALRFPATVGGRTVTAVELRGGGQGGVRRDKITSVSFPDTVTRVSGFDNFSLLMEISFPAGLQEIGDNAFRSAGLRGDLKLPAGVKLGKEAFVGTCIRRVIFGGETAVIPDGCFRYCEYLSQVRLPDGLEEIGEEAFYSCEKLKSVKIPESVKRVDDRAFAHAGLTGDIRLLPGVAYGKAVFSRTKVSGVAVREGVTEIPEDTFSGCRKIRRVSLPSTLLEIGSGAFESTADLRKVTIPANVRVVRTRAFANGTGLNSVTFEAADTELEPGVFYEWNKDGTVIHPYEGDCGGEPPENYGYLVHELKIRCLPDSTADRMYTHFVVKDYPAKYPKSVAPADPVLTAEAVSRMGGVYSLTVPEGVEKIADGALRDCRTLVTLKLPSTLKEIGDHAFSGCVNLTELKLPKHTVSIGAGAFENCSSLKRLTLEGDIASLGEGAFRGCAGIKVANLSNIPATAVPASLFENCSSLKRTFLPRGAASIGDRAFAGCGELTLLRVPGGVTAIGKDVTLGMRRSAQIVTPEGSAFWNYWREHR